MLSPLTDVIFFNLDRGPLIFKNNGLLVYITAKSRCHGNTKKV